MPHHVDFSDFKDVYTISIEIVGWKNPIIIEYTYVDDYHDTQLLWRVSGTTHTFTIYLKEINNISNGDYIMHFQQVLTLFRDDLLTWIADGLTEKWMREYVYMFRPFVLL